MTRSFLQFFVIAALSTTALSSLAFSATAPEATVKEEAKAPETVSDEANKDVKSEKSAKESDSAPDDGAAKDDEDDYTPPVKGEKKSEEAKAKAIDPTELPAACKAKLLDEEQYGSKNKSYKVIVVGNDGWMYRSHTDFIQDVGLEKKGIIGLKRLTRALEKKGTTLVVAYPPTRGIVAGGHLPAELPHGEEFNPAQATETYQGLASKMREEGLRFVTVPNFSKDDGFFRKTDQHWNVSGAREMAKEVADYAKTLKVYKDIKKTEFETTKSEVYDFQGMFSKFVEQFCGASLRNEQEQGFQTSPKAGGDDLENALMGDAPVPEVVLVGTSNSKAELFDTNFDGALKEFLSADVLNAAFPGAGIDEPMFAYLNSDHFKNTPPKIIVWEVPGYYTMSSERDMFRQAVPAVYGDCGDKAVAKIAPTKIKGGGMGDQDLLKGLRSKKIDPDSHYVYLKFNQPVKKDFTLLTDYAGGKTDKFKFRRSKRYPYDGVYYLSLKGEDDSYATGFAIKAPEEMEGLEVEGRVCRLPDSAVVKEKKKSSFFDWFKKDDDKDVKKDKKDKKRDKKKDDE